ncbi:hypothetical protein IMZ48_12525, partial [Candidatus Bathyarchaeota archaeon]|nr:hypothetical protein [Candidatus Bathyarchaeota archaeon]
FEDLFKPENRTKAVYCLNHMVLNSLKHVEECLFYMAAIKDQSVFNFVAIPQSMAIATLELVFNNPKVLDRSVKITKGDACTLMTQSTQNLHLVTNVFKRYARRIHQKNDPRDPNYLKISMQCGRIEQFIETLFPERTPEQAEKLRQNKDMAENQGMDVADGFWLTAVVVGCLFVIGVIMVSDSRVLPIFLRLDWQGLTHAKQVGAAFGANYVFTHYYTEETLSKISETLSNIPEITQKVVEDVVHEEL